MAVFKSNTANGYYLELTLTNSNPSTENNNSRVNYTLKLYATSTYFQAMSTGSLNINGVNVWYINQTVNMYSYPSSIVLTSGSLAVPHDSDGSKTVQFNMNFQTVNQTNSWRVPNLNGSGNFELTTIPSIATFNMNKLGEPFTVYTNRKSVNFTHTLSVYVNDVPILSRANVGNDILIIPTENETRIMHESVPNSVLGNVQVRCDTFSGNTLIGESRTNKNVSIDYDLCFPDFGGYDIEEMNPLIPMLTADIIYNYSELKIIIPANNRATAKLGASMKHYIVSVGNQQRTIPYTTNKVETTFNNVIGSIISVRAVDSRGLDAESNTDFSQMSITNYVPPTFRNVNLDRKDGIGTSVSLSTSIKLANVEWNNGLNEITSFKYRTRLKDGTWSDWYDKTVEFRGKINHQSDNTIVVNDLNLPRLGATGDYVLGQEYELEIEITDGNYLHENVVFPFQKIVNKFTIVDGVILEAFYKENGEYFRGYGGMPNPNFNHNFYGTVGIDGVPLIEWEEI